MYYLFYLKNNKLTHIKWLHYKYDLALGMFREIAQIITRRNKIEEETQYSIAFGPYQLKVVNANNPQNIRGYDCANNDVYQEYIGLAR